MSEIKLSFCIPTYNRADFIDQTLASIAGQIMELNCSDHIEICVSDNASTDTTGEVISRFREYYPSVQLVYSKNRENLGADLNYLRVVELASGEYCWYLGSDDILRPQALARVNQELVKGHNIYLCNRTCCDYLLHPIFDQTWLYSGIQDQDFILSNRNSFINYLNKAASIGALFSYLSSIIFQKAKWDSISYDEKFTGTAYSHVFKLLKFKDQECVLHYISNPLVYCRGSNDSFIQKSLARRVILDLDGYVLLAEELFGNDKLVYDLFLRVLNSECNNSYFYSIRSILKIRACSMRKDWEYLMNRYFELYGLNAKLNLIDKLPSFLISFTRYVYNVKHFFYTQNV